MDLISDAFDIPHKMNPGVRREWFAVIYRGLPASEVIPDIRFNGAVEVALRSPDPAIYAEGPVDVELQSLGSVGIVDVEIEVIREVADVVASSNRVEVEHVGVWGRASHGELRRVAVHRRRGLIRRHGRLGSARACGADLCVATGSGRKKSGAGLPSGHALNVADGGLGLGSDCDVENRGRNVALLVLGCHLELVLTGSNEDLRVDGIGEGEVDGKSVDVDAHNSCGRSGSQRSFSL